MARPTRTLLRQVAAALAEAACGERVDRVWRPGPLQVLIKVRLRGYEGARLLIDLEPGHARVVAAARWPDTPAAPDRPTIILRKFLDNARLEAVSADDRALTCAFASVHGPLRLVVQLAGRYPNVALFDAEGGELVRLIDGIPACDPDSPPLPDGTDPFATLAGAELLVAYDAATAADAGERDAKRRATALWRDARERHARASRAAMALERDLERAEAADADRHRGELLKTVIGRVARGASEVAVSDWSRADGGAVVVALEPTLDLIGNMERYFRRYRKFATARAGIEDRLLTALEHRDRLAALVDRLLPLTTAPGDPAACHATLAALASELEAIAPSRPRQAPPSRRSLDAPALPYRTFAAADGTEILVGKGARDNDRLTFQVARGHDLWLHARDVPGSHVILRARGQGAAPASDALLDAALLAAWNSQARGDAVIDVMWTERKHVRKVRGAAPGLVTAAATRNLAVRADADRLARLYRTLEG